MLIGERIREFEITGELGSGGFGVVYRAYDASVDREVAIKVIREKYAQEPQFMADFEREARLVAQLEHKDIVPLYSYWHDTTGAYLVMRYIRGGSLRGMIARQGALPLARVLRLSEQVAEALHAAHEAGVVHRDLKPENILVDERGNAYLTDFGIAKRIGENEVTPSDTIKGTFAYLSPEQIRQGEITPQTDVYALGIILYEMLTGKHPFYETKAAMMLMRHLNDALPPVTDLRDEVDDEINDIIQRATHKVASKRYATTLELIDELHAALAANTAPAPRILPPAPPIPRQTLRHGPPDQRNRAAMLQNVRSFWIEGVLDSSLHEAVMLDLGMKAQAGAVDNPWDSILRTSGGDEMLADQHIVHVFDRMNGKLLIMGDPGSGKTTTLLALARDLLYRAERDDEHPIPVVFNLSSWGETQLPFDQWLVDELNSTYQVPRTVAEKWIEIDEILLLLDGLDEVAEDEREACVEAINAYRAEHGFVDIVVCSRIKDYEALSNQLKLNGAIVIQALTDAQIKAYLDQLGTSALAVRDLIQRDATLREIAKSPLILSILLLAYRGESAHVIPDFDDEEAQRNHLFQVYVERMFARRAGAKAYEADATDQYLGWLARTMQEHGQSLFRIEALKPSWLHDPLTHAAYRRIARSIFMLVYSIAVFTVLTGLYIGANGSLNPLIFVLYAPIIFIHGWLMPTGNAHPLPYLSLSAASGFAAVLMWQGSPDWSVRLGVWVLFFLLGMLSFSAAQTSRVIGNALDDYALPDQVTFTLNFLQRPILLVIGAIIAVPLNLVMGVALNPMTNLGAMALGTLLTTPVLAAFLMFSESVQSANMGSLTLRPNEGIIRTRQRATRFALYSSTITSLIFLATTPSATLDVTLPVSLGVFVGVTLVGWLIHGGFINIQHYTVRHLLTRDNYLPPDLTRFLNHAAELVLMRKVGGGFIFVHRYLMEYFARLDQKRP